MHQSVVQLLRRLSNARYSRYKCGGSHVLVSVIATTPARRAKFTRALDSKYCAPF